LLAKGQGFGQDKKHENRHQVKPEVKGGAVSHIGDIG
jgi:hypothetical protein